VENGDVTFELEVGFTTVVVVGVVVSDVVLATDSLEVGFEICVVSAGSVAGLELIVVTSLRLG
jgi:hypothetical protein